MVGSNPPGEQQNAVKQWSRWTSSHRAPTTSVARSSRIAPRAGINASTTSTACARELRGAAGDPAGTARVARDAAGILAAWSLALEANRPGSLARASRQLARSAELRASHRSHHRAPEHAARRSRCSCSRARDRTAPQAGFCSRASCHCSGGPRPPAPDRGEVDRARELETGLTGQLQQLHEKLDSQYARPPADPGLAAAIQTVLKPLHPPNPGLPDARQDYAAARRVIHSPRIDNDPAGGRPQSIERRGLPCASSVLVRGVVARRRADSCFSLLLLVVVPPAALWPLAADLVRH